MIAQLSLPTHKHTELQMNSRFLHKLHNQRGACKMAHMREAGIPALREGEAGRHHHTRCDRRGHRLLLGPVQALRAGVNVGDHSQPPDVSVRGSGHCPTAAFPPKRAKKNLESAVGLALLLKGKVAFIINSNAILLMLKILK